MYVGHKYKSHLLELLHFKSQIFDRKMTLTYCPQMFAFPFTLRFKKLTFIRVVTSFQFIKLEIVK